MIEFMTSPLAILCYQKLFPGSQMVNRLEDLAYRVEVLNDASQLARMTQQLKPMVVLVDMDSSEHDVASEISSVCETTETAHIPVLAFAAGGNTAGQEAARSAGAKLVAGEDAILDQLPSLLDHVLDVN